MSTQMLIYAFKHKTYMLNGKYDTKYLINIYQTKVAITADAMQNKNAHYSVEFHYFTDYY